MRPQKLDHVALHVTDPEAVASCILAQLPFRVIEETDEFLLIGRDPELGKLTLFRAEGARDSGALRGVGIGIPCATVERTVEVGEGLRLHLVPAPPEGEVELSHVTLAVPDPEASARRWAALGFGPDAAGRLRVGDEHVELVEGNPEATARPLLYHLGVLVESLDDVERELRSGGTPIEREVDAENSRALFVCGPDGVSLEYIEHKPSFALA